LDDAGTLDLDYNSDTLLRLNASGITSYSQYTIESANNVSGNNSAILFDRNGSGIAFRLEDSTPVSKNWGFYQTNILFPDGTVQTGAAISISELKTLVSASTDFADFQTRIAAL
jgi:hypothetical protein